MPEVSPPPRNLPVRQRLLAVAIRLFRAQGIERTGIAQLVQEANTTPQGLYQNFKNKDDLVNAAISQWGEGFRTWLLEELQQRATEGEARLLLLFDLLEAWLEKDGYQGSLAINAGIELVGQHHPGKQAIEQHHAAMGQLVEDLAREADAKDPTRLAAMWQVLVDGAVTDAVIAHSPEPVRVAKQVGQTLLTAERTAREHPTRAGRPPQP
jgi:AcrR family transcriptional regulator